MLVLHLAFPPSKWTELMCQPVCFGSYKVSDACKWLVRVWFCRLMAIFLALYKIVVYGPHGCGWGLR